MFAKIPRGVGGGGETKPLSAHRLEMSPSLPQMHHKIDLNTYIHFIYNQAEPHNEKKTRGTNTPYRNYKLSVQVCI